MQCSHEYTQSAQGHKRHRGAPITRDTGTRGARTGYGTTRSTGIRSISTGAGHTKLRHRRLMHRKHRPAKCTHRRCKNRMHKHRKHRPGDRHRRDMGTDDTVHESQEQEGRASPQQSQAASTRSKGTELTSTRSNSP